ncbi:archease [Nanoarchaeota archaeon]
MKFKFLEHTADAKFQAFGKTLEEAFSNAALAMFNVITDTEDVMTSITKKIVVESENKEALLYDFLSELLILLDSVPFLLHAVDSIKIEKNKKYKLTAVVVGADNITSYPINTDIKAVTYSEMFIKEEDAGVTIQVVVDI